MSDNSKKAKEGKTDDNQLFERTVKRMLTTQPELKQKAKKAKKAKK